MTYSHERFNNKEYNKEENSFNLETDIIQMIIDEI